MKQQLFPRTLLLFGVILGFSLFASLTPLFFQAVSFSVYPVLTLGLAAHGFYHCYKAQTEANVLDHKEINLVSFASVLTGFFINLAYLGIDMPELGSNFFSVIAAMSLVLWLFFKLGWLDFLPKEAAR